MPLQADQSSNKTLPSPSETTYTASRPWFEGWGAPPMKSNDKREGTGC